jgi:hypothetical protein
VVVLLPKDARRTEEAQRFNIALSAFARGVWGAGGGEELRRAIIDDQTD